MKSHSHWLLLVAFPLLCAPSGCSDEPETEEPVVEKSGVEKPASPTVERRANSEEQVRPATNTDALTGLRRAGRRTPSRVGEGLRRGVSIRYLQRVEN